MNQKNNSDDRYNERFEQKAEIAYLMAGLLDAPEPTSVQKVWCEFTGIDTEGNRCHLVRLIEGERVIRTEVMKGDDVANDFMIRHGLIATGVDHLSPRKEIWAVEEAPEVE